MCVRVCVCVCVCVCVVCGSFLLHVLPVSWPTTGPRHSAHSRAHCTCMAHGTRQGQQHRSGSTAHGGASSLHTAHAWHNSTRRGLITAHGTGQGQQHRAGPDHGRVHTRQRLIGLRPATWRKLYQPEPCRCSSLPHKHLCPWHQAALGEGGPISGACPTEGN